ncbi:MAG: sarcosine oxidase subunit delta [Pseudomonadota bacterium]
MFIIECPWCGPREQSEFRCHGQAHIIRPPKPFDISDQEWGTYLFFRDNIKGWHREQWVHEFGCRKWFYAIRNTANDEFYCVYKVCDPLPDLPDTLSQQKAHKSHHAKNDPQKEEHQ